RCVAFGYESASLGTQAIALVFEMAEGAAEESPADAKALARAIKDIVWQECDLVLNRVLSVAAGWLVKTSSGKISRDANRSKFLQHFPQN
ncbi:MAG: hypothetical protein JKY20_00355, partial [Alphaproteobacteria bacterium]|nr:hypothetical protein [Alphaproteobacteria bacterium]